MVGLAQSSPERPLHVLRRDAIDKRLARRVVKSEPAADISEVVPQGAEASKRFAFDSRDCLTVESLPVRSIESVTCGTTP